MVRHWPENIRYCINHWLVCSRYGVPRVPMIDALDLGALQWLARGVDKPKFASETDVRNN